MGWLEALVDREELIVGERGRGQVVSAGGAKPAEEDRQMASPRARTDLFEQANDPLQREQQEHHIGESNIGAYLAVPSGGPK